MTMRVVECARCGEAQRFDAWPYDGEDSDEYLDQAIRAEEWTDRDGDFYCPDCSEKS